jgi:hypothetical protein
MSIVVVVPGHKQIGVRGIDLNSWLVLLVTAERIGVAHRHFRIRAENAWTVGKRSRPAVIQSTMPIRACWRGSLMVLSPFRVVRLSDCIKRLTSSHRAIDVVRLLRSEVRT